MNPHENEVSSSGEAAGSVAELAAINIRCFLEIQSLSNLLSEDNTLRRL